MRKSNIILTLGAILAPACLFAGWLPTGGGDFYYTNTVNWTDGVIDNVYDALCDDLNTPVAIAHLFEAVKLINAGNLSDADKASLAALFEDIVGGVLGLKDEEAGASGKAEKALDGVMQLVLENRKKAREEKNWAESDRIRDALAACGISIKDTKDGATWTLE